MFTIKNKIGEKTVILVFDDLERSRLDSKDILGIINDYCENKKFHTIIVTNEEILCSKNDSVVLYKEIKEKVVQLTNKYNPDYKKIIESIINKLFENSKYKEFLNNKIEDILNYFSYTPSKNNDNANKKIIRNIRTLKCSLLYFERVYNILIKEINENYAINKYFLSFISFFFSERSGLIDSPISNFIRNPLEKYNMLFYDINYKLYSIEEWIISGLWENENILKEIKDAKIKLNNKPKDIFCSTPIYYLDENNIKNGLENSLNNAYEGNLNLRQYVYFICNCYLLEKLNYNYEIEIIWEKIYNGIKEYSKKEKNIESVFDLDTEKIRSEFSEKYEIAFKLLDELTNKSVSCENKYIELLNDCGLEGLLESNNTVYDVFSSKMAESTVNSYKKCNNELKMKFIYEFDRMWRVKMIHLFNRNDTIFGFKKLIELLINVKNEYDNNHQKIASFHTSNFIDLVKKISECYSSTENKGGEIES